MDKPAAFFGSYVDAKFMRGLKVMRVSVDVPIEHSNEFLTAFGAPNGTDPVPVAIARLNQQAAVSPGGTVPQTADAHSADAEAQNRDKPRTPDKRVQKAGILANDPTFHSWLAIAHTQRWFELKANGLKDESARTAEFIRRECRVSSRAELAHDDAAADRFDRLVASFDYRDRV